MRNVMKKNLLKVLLMASVLSVSPVVTAESNVVYAAENEYILPDSDSRGIHMMSFRAYQTMNSDLP